MTHNVSSDLPLSDICVLAVEQYGAGPFATLQLAELGARIIKIEDTQVGDVGRYVPPFCQDEDSLFFETFNRNKESISLDLKSPQGRQVFRDLVPRADVVFSNLRGDVPVELGLMYDDLSSVNEQIVCVSLSAFGMNGPRSSEPGYDYIMQALSGWMTLTGEPDSPPAKSGLSLVDFSGGLVAAISILAAVHQARRTGRGSDCDLSLYDSSISLLTYIATWHLTRNWCPERLERSAHPSLVPFQLFRGSDDRWFVLGCGKEKFWSRTKAMLNSTELDSLAYETFTDRAANRTRLVEVLDSLFVSEPAEVWVDRLESAGVPSALVLTVDEALRDPQVAARGMIASTDHPRLGEIRQVRSAVRVGKAQSDLRPAPVRGEHSRQILAEMAEYDSTQIAELFASRIVA